MQNVVRDEPFTVFEGKVHDRSEREVSGIASELIYFGKALSVAKDSNLDALPPVVSLFNNGAVLYGIAGADPSIERLANPNTGQSNAAPYGAFPAQTAPRIVRKGRVWVKSADEVDDLTKSVFIRDADLTGTAATITDTTSYAVTDQDTKTITVTIPGYAAQVVTFAGTTTSAASVASQMNAQLVGCSVAVVGGQVVITTDAVGSTQTITLDLTDCDLTFAAVVAGTGDVAILSENSRGSFRATTASDHTEFGAGTGVKWIAAKTENGVYYGLLEINLV